MHTFSVGLTEILAIFLLFLFLVLSKYSIRRKYPNYPPGPYGIPLLGNVHQLMGSNAAVQLAKWKKKYGSIFSIKLGLDDAVIISDYKLIRELYSDRAASGRPLNPILTAVSGGDHGIVNAEGKQWEELRTFVLRTLRDLGYSKSCMDGMISVEAMTSVEYLKQFKGQAIYTDGVFNKAVLRSLWCIISGEQDDTDKESDKGITKKTISFLSALKKVSDSGMALAPFLRHIAPDWCGYTALQKASDAVKIISTESITRHKATLDVDNPQNLMDHMLVEIERNATNTDSSFYKKRGEKNLNATIMEMFIGGSESTAVTLSWCFLYLAHYPKVQKKLQNEIRSVVGEGRPVTLSDKPKLPYVQAVMLEVLRISSVAAMGLFRKMLEGRKFHDYYLPKGTMILPDLYGIHHDPEIWGDPENFRPERFLSEDGGSVIRHDAFMPFSYGGRKCVGESFAYHTLFIFIGTIFQSLTVLPDPENPKPEFGRISGFVNLAKPFKIVVQEA